MIVVVLICIVVTMVLAAANHFAVMRLEDANRQIIEQLTQIQERLNGGERSGDQWKG